MKHGITLDQVWDAMRAGWESKLATPEGMTAALKAAGLWDEDQPARVDIALSAYGLLGPAGSAESDMQRALEAVAQFIAPKPKRTAVTIGEVRQVLRDWLPESGGFIKTGDTRLLLLRERLRLEFGREAADHYARHRFEGQLNRALNSLARDGTLRKVGAGTRGPNGQVAGQREAWFFTPEAWAEAEKLTAQHRKDTDLAAQRAKDITDQLARLGMIFQTWHDGLPKLDTGAWEDLLALAEIGKTVEDGVLPEGPRTADKSEPDTRRELASRLAQHRRTCRACQDRLDGAGRNRAHCAEADRLMARLRALAGDGQ
jgi:hypothetical protein